MRDDNSFASGFFANEKFLLALGLGLALVFLGLLVLDRRRRRRRARRRPPRSPATLREKLLTPVQRVQAFWSELKKLLQERARRQRRRQRRPPEAPR